MELEKNLYMQRNIDEIENQQSSVKRQRSQSRKIDRVRTRSPKRGLRKEAELEIIGRLLDENKQLEAKLKKSRIAKRETAAKDAKRMEQMTKKDCRIADLEKQLADANKKFSTLKIENAMLRTQKTKIVKTEASATEQQFLRNQVQILQVENL